LYHLTGMIDLEPAHFATPLLAWYVKHARKPPWGSHSNPYAVWVSVVMLQQTRLETVIPFFERWIRRFPTIEALGRASLQDVLAAWEGLGYYGRARNLHKAAQMVMQVYQGELPHEAKLLRELPGIGRYTASAIASIAFGLDEPTLDGNIRRVLARYFDVSEDARSVAGEQILWELASQHLPTGKAGVYNQALMDLGATVCTPKAPNCAVCPLGETCQARRSGIQEQRPVLQPRPATPHYMVTAAIIRRGNKVLISRRPPHGLLGGLWEFPGGKLKEGEDLPACLQREIQEELGVEITVDEPLGVYRHAYTHFSVTLHAFSCSLVLGEPCPVQPAELAWVTLSELSKYPMGKIDRQISKSLVSSESL
jgi:A/G-specific adenine glycosylase